MADIIPLFPERENLDEFSQWFIENMQIEFPMFRPIVDGSVEYDRESALLLVKALARAVDLRAGLEDLLRDVAVPLADWQRTLEAGGDCPEDTPITAEVLMARIAILVESRQLDIEK